MGSSMRRDECFQLVVVDATCRSVRTDTEVFSDVDDLFARDLLANSRSLDTDGL